MLLIITCYTLVPWMVPQTQSFSASCIMSVQRAWSCWLIVFFSLLFLLFSLTPFIFSLQSWNVKTPTNCIKEEGESKCTYLDKDSVVCAWRRIEIRKSDSLTCKANSLKWGCQKEQLKITIKNLPFPWEYCVLAPHFRLAWRAVVLQASTHRICCDGHQTVQVVGTIVVSVCWPPSSTFVSHWLD